jgi:hypothetical protein
MYRGAMAWAAATPVGAAADGRRGPLVGDAFARALANLHARGEGRAWRSLAIWQDEAALTDDPDLPLT